MSSGLQISIRHLPNCWHAQRFLKGSSGGASVKNLASKCLVLKEVASQWNEHAASGIANADRESPRQCCDFAAARGMHEQAEAAAL